MIYEEMTENIRAICEKLLNSGEVELVVAYTGRDVDGLQVPYVAEKPEEVKYIEWGDRCWQNIAPYLHGLGKKAAILAKPCDVRIIAQYITEQQIKREDVVIIGVDCMGMVDMDGEPRPGCPDCDMRKPPFYDEYIRDERVDEATPQRDASNKEADLEENLGRFQKEMDKCILCYTCRQACYGCYCKNCFIERDLPDWQPAEIDTGTKMMFHMGRAMHLSGRCIECGACEASCESGVDVRYIIKEVTNFIEDEYGYKTGMDPDEKPAMLTNKFDDREIGFLGEDNHD